MNQPLSQTFRESQINFYGNVLSYANTENKISSSNFNTGGQKWVYQLICISTVDFLHLGNIVMYLHTREQLLAGMWCHSNLRSLIPGVTSCIMYGK
jgi:hypothetical protein